MNFGLHDGMHIPAAGWISGESTLKRREKPRLCAIICTCLALLPSVSPRLHGEIWVSLFNFPITRLLNYQISKLPTPVIHRTPSHSSQIGVDFSDFSDQWQSVSSVFISGKLLTFNSRLLNYPIAALPPAPPPGFHPIRPKVTQGFRWVKPIFATRRQVFPEASSQ